MKAKTSGQKVIMYIHRPYKTHPKLTVIDTAATVYFAIITDGLASPFVTSRSNVPLEYSLDIQLPNRMINALNPMPDMF